MQVLENLLLPLVVVRDGERLQLLKVQTAFAIDLQQPWADRAELEALPHHVLAHAEAGRNVRSTPSAIVRKLVERLELIGGVHVRPRHVLVKADFLRVVRGIQNATDCFGLFDFLALHAQKLRLPAAFSDGHEKEAGRLAVRVKLRLHHEVLIKPLGRDAGRKRFDMRLAVRCLPCIAGRLLELFERNEDFPAGHGFRCGFCRHNGFRFRCGQCRYYLRRAFPDAADFRIHRHILDRINSDGLHLLRCPCHCSNPFLR
ncbi:hypothetical protein D3C87_1269360 [compost metagenome]